MPLTKNSIPSKVQFMFFGIPYILPASWVKGETWSITNTIQQSVNPRYEPAMTFSSSNLTVKIKVPSELSMPHKVLIMTLKAALKTLSEGLSSSEYANITQDEQIAVDAIGMIVSPWSKIRDPADPAAKLQRGDKQAMISGYTGRTNHLMGGYLRSFGSELMPNEGCEMITINFESVNLTTIRQQPPKFEGVPDAASGQTGVTTPNLGNTDFINNFQGG